MSTARGRRAFTLVELLAVIAIIVSIVALLFPAATALRQRARATACLANLRSLQQASLAYSADHAGWLIDARLPHGGLEQGSEGSFVDVLARMRYCDTSLIRSPLDDSPHWSAESGGQGVPVPGTTNFFRRTSYGLNNHVAREFSPWAAVDPSLATDRLSKVGNHANTVQLLMMATTGSFAGADHPHVEGWGAASASATIAASEVQIAAVTDGVPTSVSEANWSFLDGHVETASFATIYAGDQRNRLDPRVSSFYPNAATAP
jgi:prepilin-type N-terminal cleavage/methylation domain-containing protein/prepilin-type processing-associated H-X9-DG protein